MDLLFKPCGQALGYALRLGDGTTQRLRALLRAQQLRQVVPQAKGRARTGQVQAAYGGGRQPQVVRRRRR